MSNLIEAFRANGNLVFVDAKTEKRRSLDELLALAPALPDLGGKRLAFAFLDNSVESLAAFFRLLESPHAVALLSADLHPTLKKELEKSWRPDLVFDPSRQKLAFFDQKGGFFIKKRLAQKPRPIAEPLKILLSTSGTTGSPKFVKLSEANLLANARSIASYLPIEKTDVAPLNLPIFYSYGLSVLTSNALAGGSVVCGLPDMMQKDFWVAFEKMGFTTLAGVPFNYEILARIGFLKKAWPSLRYLTQAGGRLSEKFVEQFHAHSLEHGHRFFVMYGQTEATARMSWLDPAALPAKIGSIGKAIPGGYLAVADSGELVYEGPNVFGGYAEKGADLAFFEPKSRLETGDLARVDDDGFFFIVGRLKRFVKITGQRVNLDEVERLLKNEFKTTFACLGLEDKQLLIFTADGEKTAAEIQQFLFKMIGTHPTAVRLRLLEAFPMTANGKIDYQKLTAEK